VRGSFLYFVIRSSVMKSLFFTCYAFIFISCSYPGYSIRINIDQDAKATENDIKLITNYLSETTHEVLLVKEKDFWKVESYRINLDEDKFKNVNHKYINFTVEYYYVKNKIFERKLIEKIEVRIGNSWEGRNPVLKNEIDRVADYIFNQLRERFDASKISIERRYTGPV
jgi:hypothetical protein